MKARHSVLLLVTHVVLMANMRVDQRLALCFQGLDSNAPS